MAIISKAMKRFGGSDNQTRTLKTFTQHLAHANPWLLKCDLGIKSPLLTTKAGRRRGRERAAAMMGALMEFQWANLPEVDGGESHCESRSCDCSALLCTGLRAPIRPRPAPLLPVPRPGHDASTVQG